MSLYLRALLDENIPTKLKYRLHSEYWLVSTVRDENWLGKKNGELLRLMEHHKFNVLITNDKSLVYQQNIYTNPIIVLQLNALSNRYDDLLVLVPKITVKLLEIKEFMEKQERLTSMLLINL